MRLEGMDKAYVVLLATTCMAGLIFSQGSHSSDIHIHDTKFSVEGVCVSVILAVYILPLSIANYWIGSAGGGALAFRWAMFISASILFYGFSIYVAFRAA